MARKGFKKGDKKNIKPALKCGRTNKVCFKSHPVAMARLQELDTTRHTNPSRVYRCIFCSFYHFTSKPRTETL